MQSVTDLLVPALAEGCALRSEEGRAWIELPDGAVTPVPAEVALLLDLCDGTRNRGDVIAALIDRVGLGQDAASGLVEEVGAMGALVFRAVHQHVETFGEPRHTCLGCGRSCEGWTVGPLDDEEVARIERAHAELARDHARVAAHPPIEHVEDGDHTIRSLTFPDGRCLFLDEERRCLLHAHLGADAKPSICQRFPVSSIIVEDATRVGVRPACYRYHRTYQDGGPVDLLTFGTTPAGVRAVNAHADRHADRAVYRAMVFDEADILERLSDPAMTLAEHVHRLAGAPPCEPPRPALPVQAVGLLQRCLVELSADGRRRFSGEHSAHADASLRFLEALDALQHAAPDTLSHTALQPRWRHYAFHLLGQAVFLREVAMFPSVTAGAMVQAIGVWAAAACVPGPDGERLDDDDAFDAFGELLVAWLRLVNERRMLALFATHDAYEAFLDTLRQNAGD